MDMKRALMSSIVLLDLLVCVTAAMAVTITQVTSPCPPALCLRHDFEESPRWSPDGKNIAILHSSVDLNYQLTGGNVIAVAAPGVTDPETPNLTLGLYSLNLAPHSFATTQPTWAPDGQRVACNYNGELVVLVANDTTVSTVAPGTGFWGRMDWAPHDDAIAVSLAGSLATIDVATGLMSVIQVGPHAVGDPAWSPDAQWIAYSDNSAIWIVPSGGGSPTLITDGGTNKTPSWSPDGQSLAFASDRSGNWDIWIVDLNSGKTLQVTTDPSLDNCPDWSPDGERIVFVSQRNAGGFSHIWMASDLHTLSVESATWGEMKRQYR